MTCAGMTLDILQVATFCHATVVILWSLLTVAIVVTGVIVLLCLHVHNLTWSLHVLGIHGNGVDIYWRVASCSHRVCGCGGRVAVVSYGRGYRVLLCVLAGVCRHGSCDVRT